MARIFRRVGVFLQCTLIGGTAALALAPPIEGAMLVAPLTPVSPSSTLSWVLPTGVKVLAIGPYDGSLIVYGERSALIGSATKHGTVLLRSSFAGCGSGTRTIA